ncbi:MAG: hypothetical protein AAGB93_15600 [Planctomycetota bacterium]
MLGEDATTEGEDGGASRARRNLVAAVAATLLVRLAIAIALGLPRPLEPGDERWDWAYEQGAVSAAVLRGDGFADPFAKDSGPTAWCGVVYPTLLAGCIAVTDGPNDATKRAAAALHVLLGAIVTWQLAALGAALGRRRHGLAAAWLWAVHPLATYYELQIVWDNHLVATAVLGALLALARAGPGASLPRMGRAGAWFGFAAFVNPTALALAPGLLVYAIRGRGAADAARAVATYLGAALLVCLPWMARNAALLGSPQLKLNFGVELLVGNNELADGQFNPRLHPSYTEPEWAEFQARGEKGYSDWAKERALQWIEANPERFATLCLIRVRNFWLGLDPTEPIHHRGGGTQERDYQGWIKWFVHLLTGVLALIGLATYRDARGGWWLVGGAAVTFPLVYYVTHVLERYRLSLEPVLTYLAAGVVLAVIDRVGRRLGPESAARPGAGPTVAAMVAVSACALIAGSSCARTETRTEPVDGVTARPSTGRLVTELWDFGDPAASARRFGAARDAAIARGDLEQAAELETQVARAEGLQREFDDAHRRLDRVEADVRPEGAPENDARWPAARVRVLLERGRVLHSSGDAAASRAPFLEAWDLAREQDLHGLAVDAAHMLGIVAEGEEALEWNLRAIEYAESSEDPRARRWLASLYNNTAWTLHDSGDPEAALELFERALAERRHAGDEERALVARWSVARCMRTLGRLQEALGIQRDIASDRAAAGLPPDGFVHEELGELLLELGEPEEAREEFARALPLLRGMRWLVESEPGRIERLENLALEE